MAEITNTREELVYNAKLSEQTERFEDMAAAMKKVTEMNQELSLEERNLLSVAHKNVVGARRSSCRVLSSIEEKMGKSHSEFESIRKYRRSIEKELKDLCEDVLDLLDSSLIPSAKSEEGKVFYYKLKGDYHRYLAEVFTGDEKKAEAEKGLAAYKAGMETARDGLKPTHPIRLGLCLNFSVFHKEILDDTEASISLAKSTFDAVRSELDNLDDDQAYKDSTLIMQLLKDNLDLWTAEDQEKEDEQEDVKQEDVKQEDVKQDD